MMCNIKGTQRRDNKNLSLKKKRFAKIGIAFEKRKEKLRQKKKNY